MPSPSSKLETEEAALTFTQFTLKSRVGIEGSLRVLELVHVSSSCYIVGILGVGNGTLS